MRHKAHMHQHTHLCQASTWLWVLPCPSDMHAQGAVQAAPLPQSVCHCCHGLSWCALLRAWRGSNGYILHSTYHLYILHITITSYDMYRVAQAQHTHAQAQAHNPHCSTLHELIQPAKLGKPKRKHAKPHNPLCYCIEPSGVSSVTRTQAAAYVYESP